MTQQTVTIELTKDQAELIIKALTVAQQAAALVARWGDLSKVQNALAVALVKLSRPNPLGQ